MFALIQLNLVMNFDDATPPPHFITSAPNAFSLEICYKTERRRCEQNKKPLWYHLMAYDVRSVANFVLDVADAERQEVSNLHINKIVYFLHADFLVAFSRPLVSAKIEAWTHGPVFREIYREFKVFGAEAITGRAQYLDPESGRKVTASYAFDKDEERFILEQTRRYIRMSAGALVSQSHVEGGPWDQTWNHDGNTNASMRISDDLIKDWYGKAVKH